MREFLGKVDENRVKFLVCQEREDEITDALNTINDLIDAACDDKRSPVPVSELVIGLKCGGSDGLSGITANPLIGAVSDCVTAQGGSSILTEVPEMFGAEALLMNRCRDRAVFDKMVFLINDFKGYFLKHGYPIYENPSPGNKAGGITTLEEKSLGCTQKSGFAAITDVLRYGEAVREKGLNLLQSPGSDLVSATALTASGAHMILFSTGLGTPAGVPAPTVKISSSTPLYQKKRNWIDFDAGELIPGASLEELAKRLYAQILKVACGDCLTKSEQRGIRDIVILKTGVTL
jgi:altronate hydrolase